MIAGGGTGGHAIPALCVADNLQERGAVIEFIGSLAGIERDLVPRAGYTLHPLNLTGLAGNPLAQARASLLSLRAIASCRRIIQRFRPLAVLGVGGYASAPAVVAARTLGVATFLHEQNSVPGRVNRLASRFTEEALVTFPAAGGHLRRARWVGMPTRTEAFGASREEAIRALGVEPPVVLIFGGSGGALKINLAAMEAFRGQTSYTVIQVSGRRDFARLSTENPRHVILEYVDEIWRYLAAASVVVSRAGAGSLFDIAAAGRAAILIPFPHATGDHQTHNARYFTERGAAELMADSEVGAVALRGRVEELLNDDPRRERLAERIGALATPGAAGAVAERLLGVAEKKEIRA
ncbi:MAG: UDP-N-acetylglucosamine--N-acetylmuramyl-(pentapeptide) pyrophosphoryl-undecaprenol N-acetylglucosamine transferase [Actinomycetota bacterium]|nr:UDP-N-acetylglucosamine--N-acetylmuramyl-(pentapeptide) pyrophosphoryl-undecaprenol N-acetylglucosamine transferase [Actinomycetota bacterium]